MWILLYMHIPIPITKLMVMEGKKKEIKYDWVSLDEVSGNVQLATMCAEDQNFLLHHGLDFRSIEDAFEKNQKGGKVRGASTLTQQVAKNIFLWPTRSWPRKMAEMYYSLLIEVFWSKERIMEVYLNVAEMGDGIFGIEAASQHYFDKSAEKLTSKEAALIAAMLPSPKRYSAANPDPYVIRRAKWIELQMKQWGNKMTYDRSFVEKMISP